MDSPTLDALLADFAAWETAHGRPDSSVVLSPVTASKLPRIEAELGIQLPDNYTALALRYNLAAIEFNFSRFCPPVVGPMGLFEAFNALLNSGQYPFSAEYRRWGVVPVGEVAWQNELVLVVRQPTEPQEESQPREMTHPLALTRPYSTVWSFYPDEMHPTLRYTFEFIGVQLRASPAHVLDLLARVYSSARRSGVRQWGRAARGPGDHRRSGGQGALLGSLGRVGRNSITQTPRLHRRALAARPRHSMLTAPHGYSWRIPASSGRATLGKALRGLIASPQA